MKSIYYHQSPVGKLGIGEEQGKITDLFFASEAQVEGKIEKTALIEETMRQLDEYFQGQRKTFNLPLDIRATPFRKTVLTQLLSVPYGEVRSYKQLARMAGNPKACRAVGTANAKNPIAIVIPCHRIISSDGSLGGYGGGLKIKQMLLDLEKSNR